MNQLSREIPIVPRKTALLFIDVQNYNARSDGGEYRDEGLTPDEVKKLLTDNASPMSGVPNACQGAGVVDLAFVAKGKKINVSGATQAHVASDGSGLLELTRGGEHLVMDGVALTGEQDIMGSPWIGFNEIVTVVAVDRVVARTAQQSIFVITAKDQIVAGAAGGRVPTGAGVDRVVARAAHQDVVLRGPGQVVVPVLAVEFDGQRQVVGDRLLS